MTLELFAFNAAAVLTMMTLLWMISVKLSNASIVDPFWSIGFLLIATVTALYSGVASTPTFVLLALVGVWSIRLWLHLLVRAWKKPEDHRYQAFRQQFGAQRYWWVSFFQVFLLQGVLMLIISAPLQVALAAPAPEGLHWLHGLGAFIAIVGISIESVADWQLGQFRADVSRRGEVLDTGLWRYSRHPNYFGEALIWWGFWLIATPSVQGWTTIFAPILMTFLLVRVSGVALLEQTLQKSKPAYHQYIRQTSAFVMMPPKK